jgi:hypothetical protein
VRAVREAGESGAEAAMIAGNVAPMRNAGRRSAASVTTILANVRAPLSLTLSANDVEELR